MYIVYWKPKQSGIKMDRYRVKLLPGHDARPDQECDGYLTWMGRIMDYTEKEAIYKAYIMGGRA